METTTTPAELRQDIQTALGFVNIKSPTDVCGGQSDYFQCPESLGPGGCCPIGYVCGDGMCLSASGETIGTTTIISVITVSATQVADTGVAAKEHLTRADIAGVMGGVIGALLLLSVVIWLIMRRLNGLMKYVQARLGPPPGN
ncbi:hypothetical protein GGR58DRAFT_507940 [Xylaria digitata]|nr:hypothetical protein GGR58DRAFT_507940 [Xylaria digitata]